jgi:hypothetical protein
VKRYSIILLATLLLGSKAHACEPVLPFVQAVEPTIALSSSVLVLLIAVAFKSVLFSVFERRLSLIRSAWRMFLGSILTSFVGVLVAVMIGNGAAWFVGVPVVFALCWLPARRLVKVSPKAWLRRISPLAFAGLMTAALLLSCILFAAGQEAIQTRRLLLYWVIKLTAIFFALLASVTLTTIWEEWAIWRLSSHPENTNYFPSVLRANLYVLVFVMAIAAMLILPRRLRSPDFLAKRSGFVVVELIQPRPIQKPSLKHASAAVLP